MMFDESDKNLGNIFRKAVILPPQEQYRQRNQGHLQEVKYVVFQTALIILE